MTSVFWPRAASVRPVAAATVVLPTPPLPVKRRTRIGGMLRGRDAPAPGRERDPGEEEGGVAVDRVVPAAPDRGEERDGRQGGVEEKERPRAFAREQHEERLRRDVERRHRGDAEVRREVRALGPAVERADPPVVSEQEVHRRRLRWHRRADVRVVVLEDVARPEGRDREVEPRPQDPKEREARREARAVPDRERRGEPADARDHRKDESPVVAVERLPERRIWEQALEEAPGVHAEVEDGLEAEQALVEEDVGPEQGKRELQPAVGVRGCLLYTSPSPRD